MKGQKRVEYKKKKMEVNIPKHEYYARAFVSCSLRPEDEPFVDFVCDLLDAYHIKPIGTVGKFFVAPENPIDSMKKNIKDADIVVICATPRYTLKDIYNGNETNGLSEMIHVETGMALSTEKPIVAFVKEGTNVGSVIPNITQYVVLSGTKKDYKEKENIVSSLLNNAYKLFRDKFIQREKETALAKRNKENADSWATIGKVATLMLAGYIIIKYVK